ncbi:hypothetical protein LTR16_002034 [Cryomyces antarcticus]|uniref:Uncharacterized protein n=1 Tax=Cryomyces antarcticus TaxID=329879 RepID=A0ABR0M7U5_9PEZI|nr:hypothetical protein LTR16_002034 [Cryomyces antarcticus]
MPGEMKADECIESIFAGGAGFTDTIAPSTAPSSYNNTVLFSAKMVVRSPTTAKAASAKRAPQDREMQAPRI